MIVADDDPDTTHSLCQLVKYWGHDARGAHDGAEALAVAFTFRPDVLLLDVAMPRMSGYDVARHLRDDVRFEDTLLIAVTGYADEGHCLLGASSGFDHYLVKPVKPSIIEQLLTVESTRLEGSRRRAPQVTLYPE